MSTAIVVVLALLFVSALAAAVFAVLGRAGAQFDRDEEREVLKLFGRLGRRSGERRSGTDRRREPWRTVTRERRRGERRTRPDRRDPHGPRDDRVGPLP